MTTSAVPNAARATGPASFGRVLNIVSLLAIVLALWSSWRRFPAVWTNDRSHGYVIAGLCLWLIWRDRAELRRLDEPLPGALLLLSGVSMLWMVAVALSAQVVHLALAPAILLLWLLAVQGVRAARHGVQIAAVFLLAVPVWEALTGPLQTLTVIANSALVFITRIPARVEGTMIHLSAGTLQVAYSCAGINYLMSGLTLGACYAFLFTTPWRTRIKIVLVAGAVSMLSNWIRVFGLVVIGHVTDMRSSLMRDHVVYGWVVFAAFLPLFFYLARRIELRDAARGTVKVLSTTAEEQSPPPVRVGMATCTAVVGPLLLLLLLSSQERAIVPSRPPGVAASVTLAPATSPGTASSNTANSAGWRARFERAQQHLIGTSTVDGREVQVERFVYGTQEQGAEMIGGDNRIADDSVVAAAGIMGPLDDQLRTVREVLLRTNDGAGRVAWYWYHVAGVNTPSANKAKLLELWAFLNRKPSSEIVVMSASCVDRNCLPARRALFEAATGKSMPTAATR